MLQEEVAVRETDVFSLRAKVQELGKETETAVNEKKMLEKKNNELSEEAKILTKELEDFGATKLKLSVINITR